MKDFFDNAEILNVLHGFNPWWSGRPYAVPSFRRLAYGACRSYLDNPDLRRAILLSGPRRVGKTTLLQQLAEGFLREGADAKSILYLSLDHPLLKLLSLRDILALYHAHLHPEGKPALLLLDEVQYASGWETEVKLLVDHQPAYRIVATGSASVVHKEKLAESGVGRWITLPVPTLSFYEFVHIRNEAVPDLSATQRPADLFIATDADRLHIAAQLRPLLPLFNRYLLTGGFPETARQDDIALCQRLLREDVVERVLKRDMTALFGVRNVNDLERLFIYLCLHTGGILAHNTVARDLETSAATVGNHLELLRAANLVYCLPPVAISGKKVLRARNKYYLVDAALRNAVLLRGEEVLANADDMGMIVETTVLRHLYAYHYRDTPQIAYWRDAVTGKEVDIIVKSPAYHFAFEIKYRSHAEVEAKSGLALYCNAEKLKQAYLVTQQDTDFGVTELPGVTTRFLRVPAHILCYLLGQAERLLWK
ncbi:hypothetical protein EDC61_108123 [Sulfuritortus calidifontis]|uniref:AAA+ ATPase domain-containing protein n=1 Tax=Sulfuritortus calidifontis TaxID=1914471 RepID=A0A4R3JXC6_9PROT|nr:ATP-binding protein [Sulfuritortus calidifontis]TCS71780.1 hypothetical protein EDC61_108123 [Sulfuritortus calidifontis]